MPKIQEKIPSKTMPPAMYGSSGCTAHQITRTQMQTRAAEMRKALAWVMYFTTGPRVQLGDERTRILSGF